MRLSEDWASRIGRLILTLMLMLGWTGGPMVAATQSPSDSSAAPDPEKTFALLGRLDEMGRKALDDPRASVGDIAGQAGRLGHDPHRIFEFVRDQIGYEPYPGVLRGAKGALAARSGNSADKALLLKAMLECSGQACRLVSGKLSADQAGVLVKQFLASDPLKGPLGELISSSTDTDSVARLCHESGLDQAKTSKVLSDLQQHADALDAYADQQTSATSDYLETQLKQSNISIGQSVSHWMQELCDHAARHVWVQLKDDSGKWVDLDPCFADSQFGQTRGSDASVVSGELPDRYQVTFTLNYAHTTADGVKEETILSAPIDAAQALFTPVDFAIRPAQDVPSPDKLLAMNPEDRVKALSAIQKFQGMIRFGGRIFASRVFDLKGNLFDVSSDGRIEGAQKMGGAVGGMFGGGLGGGGASKPDQTAFKSLSMSISFDVPEGHKPIPPQRRVLLKDTDLKGEHVLSPMLDWDVLIQPQIVSATLSQTGTLRHLLAAIEPAVAMSRSNNFDLNAIAQSAPEPYPMMLMQWSMFREAALARALKNSPVGAVLWDSPQVIVAERRFCMNKSTGHTCDRSRIDIVHNGLSIVPRDAAHEAGAARMALRQGIFDTVSEGVMLKDAFPDSILSTAIGALDQARSGGAHLAAFSASAIGGAPLSPEDRALIQSTEADRRILVPSSSSASSAWWSLDPRTGSIIGRASGGYGGALVENAAIQQAISFAACGATGTIDMIRSKPGRDKAFAVTGFLVCFVAGNVGFTGAMMGKGAFVGWLAILNGALTVGLAAAR